MLVRLLADENVKRQLVTGLRRRLGSLDLVTVREAGLAGMDDPGILAWAAREERILLTHDVGTMTRFTYERLRAGLEVPGVIVVPDLLALGRAIDDLCLVLGASTKDDLAQQVVYLPL